MAHLSIAPVSSFISHIRVPSRSAYVELVAEIEDIISYQRRSFSR